MPYSDQLPYFCSCWSSLLAWVLAHSVSTPSARGSVVPLMTEKAIPHVLEVDLAT